MKVIKTAQMTIRDSLIGLWKHFVENILSNSSSKEIKIDKIDNLYKRNFLAIFYKLKLNEKYIYDFFNVYSQIKKIISTEEIDSKKDYALTEKFEQLKSIIRNFV
jgi:hypothetical protein